MDGGNLDLDTRRTVATIVTRTLGLHQDGEQVDHNTQTDDCLEATIMNDDRDKTTVAAVLALAAQFKPWVTTATRTASGKRQSDKIFSTTGGPSPSSWELLLSPVPLIAVAVSYDLWHAAECICASVADAAAGASNDGNEIETKSSSNNLALLLHNLAQDAINALVQEAWDAKLYRTADTHAAQFYQAGGKEHFLRARLWHAQATVTKVIEKKRAWPVIERQIERLQRSAERVLADGVVNKTEAQAAVMEICEFALSHLQEAGHVDEAHRLAQIYSASDYIYDEEAIAQALQARREKYLQWEDCFPCSTPPEVLSTPEALLAAFAGRPLTGLFGFDVEWGDEDKGAALLQIAFPAKTATRLNGEKEDDFVVLIDIPALSSSLEGFRALENTVGRLFSSPPADAKVVGFGCRQDAVRLRASPCCPGVGRHWFTNASAIVDLQKLLVVREPCLRGLGLSRTCEHYLGKPLDKSEQCSFWNMRPLTVAQRSYAALDAWACLCIYQKVVSDG